MRPPLAKHGFVDHTLYDTTSILRLITHRYHLPVLAGIKSRDAALVANGYPALGDLTNALNFGKGHQNGQGKGHNGKGQDGNNNNDQGN